MTYSSDHFRALAAAVVLVDAQRLASWGSDLAAALGARRRLLVAGNGGSAATAQHLAAELVGRFQIDRGPLSAIALHSDMSTITAIGNDFSFKEVFARQVSAHGREGDILLTISTSGESENLLRAADVARSISMRVWALAGAGESRLTAVSDESVCISAEDPATVQECHLAAIHMMCLALDDALSGIRAVADPAPREIVDIVAAPLPQMAAPLPQTPGQTQKRKFVIVGDLMLDRDVIGTADRLSPEAPVPVVEAKRTSCRPGGAGLAALIAADSSGWDVSLVTACGEDREGDQVLEMLSDAGVGVVNLGIGGRTMIKTRVRVGGRTVLRFDEGTQPSGLDMPPTDVALNEICSADALLVCDYGRGVAADTALRAAISGLPSRVPVVWDPHPNGAPPVEGVVLVVPNAAEARQSVPTIVGEGLIADVERARYLLERWPVRLVAVTRGREGAVLVQDSISLPLVVPTEEADGKDECGAGDSFAVAATMLLGSGLAPSGAIAGAVRAASQYVSRGGPEGLSPASDSGQARRLRDGVVFAAGIRAWGGRVVATGGCFDLLHAGHLSLLENARKLGDCLVVCLNSDASVARLKGADRPLIRQDERAEMLLALNCVDAVTIFDEDTPAQALHAIRPDVYVKGGDYGLGRLPEQSLIESWGGQVLVLPYLQGHSTTSLIEAAARRSGGNLT